MTSGFQPIQLAVKHMRNRRQRMPVLGMNMAKRPGDTGQAEPASYFRIFVDVGLFIVVHEFVPERLAKNNPRNCREKNADADSQPAAVRFRHSS